MPKTRVDFRFGGLMWINFDEFWGLTRVRCTGRVYLRHQRLEASTWLKWGGQEGLSPPAPIWAPRPAMVWAPPDWIYSVILCVNNAKLVGLEWVWGLLQPGFVGWAPLLHKTTLTTAWSSASLTHTGKRITKHHWRMYARKRFRTSAELERLFSDPPTV